MTTPNLPPSFGAGNSAHHLSDDREQIQQQVVDWLRVFVGSPQVVHLLAVEVRRPGLDCAIQIGGYFDIDHLNDMAVAALELSGRCRGVYFTLNPLIADVLARCRNRVGPLSRGGSASDVDVERRRWLMVDVDTRSPSGVSATDAEKANAMSRAIQVRSYLESLGFPVPILTDSGNGFHLYYQIDLSPNDELPRRVLRALSSRFTDDRAKIDAAVADPSRLTRVYGTLSCKGDSLPDRPHRTTQILELPREIRVVDALVLARAIVPVSTMADVVRRSGEEPQADQRKLGRASAYVARMPPAVSGDRGHDRTFEVACRLVLGFNLSVEQSMPLMQEYNARCDPPWSESELRHKLEQADQQPEPRERGYLLASSLQPSPPASISAIELPLLSGPVFPSTVPDFLAAPRVSLAELTPENISRPPGRPATDFLMSTYWLLLHAIRDQRRSPVVIPDVLFRACLYGASWPTRWRERFIIGGQKRFTAEHARLKLNKEQIERNRIAEQLGAALASGRSETDTVVAGLITLLEERTALARILERHSGPIAGCPPECPLHGSPWAHKHYWFTPTAEFLGATLWQFAEERDAGVVFDFDKKDGDGNGLLGRAIRSNDLYWTYVPIEIFGEAAGMPRRQVRLVQGLMRERTRIYGAGRKKAGSVDRSQYITNGMVPGLRGSHDVRCPYLDRADRFICFCGNLLAHRGRGYRLIGDLDSDVSKLGGWLRRLGYPALRETPSDELWRWVSFALSDLAELGTSFGLTAVALGRDDEWRTAEEMSIMLRTGPGQRWLGQCRLRVYAPAGYLVRWRHWFASRLGFSFIAGGEWSVGQPNADENANANVRQITAEAAKLWMRSTSMTQKALAERIGWTEARVSRQLTGRHRMSDELAMHLRCLMRGPEPQSGC